MLMKIANPSKLRRMLHSRGIKTYEDMRAQFGFGPSTIAKVRKGRTVSERIIWDISDYLEVEPEEIAEPDKARVEPSG